MGDAGAHLKARVRDQIRKLPAVCGRDEQVLLAVDDERGHLDLVQSVEGIVRVRGFDLTGKCTGFLWVWHGLDIAAERA